MGGWAGTAPPNSIPNPNPNLSQVFGLSRRSFSWLLPSFKAPPGDGMEFPTNPGGALHEV